MKRILLSALVLVFASTALAQTNDQAAAAEASMAAVQAADDMTLSRVCFAARLGVLNARSVASYFEGLRLGTLKAQENAVRATAKAATAEGRTIWAAVAISMEDEAIAYASMGRSQTDAARKAEEATGSSCPPPPR